MGQSVVHEYHASESGAQRHQRSSWYSNIIRKKWGAGGLYIIPKNDPRQMQGVDVIASPCDLYPKQFTLDNKFREKLWDDVLLELLSNEETERLGWTCGDLKCDFIGYWFVETRGGFLISWPSLRAAWESNAASWTGEFGVKRSYNESGGRKWTTVNVPVPVRELESAGVVLEWLDND